MNNEISFECLKPHERDFFVSRISCGYYYLKINEVKFKYIHPNNDLMLKANEIYSDSYNECLNKTVSNTEILDLLVEQYGWTYENESFLEEFHSSLKQIKIDLYKSMYNTVKKVTLKQKIRELEKEYNRLFSIKNTFNHMTAEGIAESNKWSFIANNCVFSVQNRRQTFNIQKTKQIVNLIWENYITDKSLRDLCKNEPWSSIWYASRGVNLFKGKYSNYNNEQIRLISWSRMYDNIRKSHKPPLEDVIEDDDILDGWMAQNAIERDKERNVSDMENRITNPKIKNAQSIFVPVSTKEEARKVDDLNSDSDKLWKKGMMNNVKGT